MKILIVGGVAGGASAAARLRRLNEEDEIIMFERGEFISFANCGLPYYIGEKIKDKSDLTLQTPAGFKQRFNIDVRVFNEVTRINRDKKTLSVKNLKTEEVYEETYDKLVLSMGAKPIKPPIKGIDNKRIFTIRNIPDTYKIKDYIDIYHPKSAVVVGGGYIGVEMAENLKEVGLDVTIVELSNHLIAPLDIDMACDVHQYIKQEGIKLVLDNGVNEIEEVGPNLNVKLREGEITTDMVVMCVGVSPETDLAIEAGLKTNQRRSIIVDKNMLTDDEDIYAVGDSVAVTDFVTRAETFIPLAGPANKQGRIAADHINGIDSQYKGTQGTAILKLFDMTIATTGINEKQAIEHKLNYDKIFIFPTSHAGYYPGAHNMSIKVIYEKETGKILGAQIVGFDGVDKRADVFATAIRFNATAYDLTELELSYAPPFGSAKDPVNFAGYVIENILKGKARHFHWHEVDDLPRDGSVTLLDVRTKRELNSGSIDGFMNIELDDLRANLHKLDKSKPIYVTCFSGHRSYLATRILENNGFKTYTLSGGYRLYKLATMEKQIPKLDDSSCH